MRMPWAELLQLQTWPLWIEAAGGLLITGYSTAAFFVLITRRDRTRAKRLVGEGALNALSFIVSATLLKTLFLTSWSQIGLFACILLLRTLLKRVFQAEVREVGPTGQ